MTLPKPSSVAQGALIISLGALASRILGYFRDYYLVQSFGIKTDVYGAYTTAFLIPDQLYYWLAGGTLAAAFIPVIAGLIGKGDQEQADRVGSTIANLMSLIIIVGVIIEFLFMPLFVRLIGPGYKPGTYVFNLTVALGRIVCVTVIFFAISGLATGILNSYHHFLIQVVAYLLWNTVILIGITVLSKLAIFGGSPQHPSIHAVAISVVLATICLAGVQIPILFHFGFHYRPILDLHNEGVKTVITNFVPVMFGLAASQFSLMSVPKIMGSLVGAPSVGVISMSIKLATVPLGLFGMAIATASFPKLSKLTNLEDREEFRRTISGSIKAILFLSVPSCVALFVLAEPANYLLWSGSSGQFDQASAQATAFVLMFLTWNLLGLSVMQITNRAYFSMGDTVRPMIVSLAMTAQNIAFSFLLVHVSSLGYAGIALSTTLTTTLAALVLLDDLRQRLGGVHGKSLLVMTMKIFVAAVLMGVTMYVVGHALAPTLKVAGLVEHVAPIFRWPAPFVPHSQERITAVAIDVSRKRLLLQFMAMGMAGVAVYLLTVWALKVEEVKVVGARLMAKLRRSPAVV